MELTGGAVSGAVKRASTDSFGRDRWDVAYWPQKLEFGIR